MFLYFILARHLFLTARNTNNTTEAASGLGVLTTDTKVPVVTKTTVRADLLEALKVLTEGRGDLVSNDLLVLASSKILLSVEEPEGDLELLRVLHDSKNFVDLLLGELTSALSHVNVSLLANEVGETATNSLRGMRNGYRAKKIAI